MRRAHYLFFTLIVGALVFSQYDLTRRIKNKNSQLQASAGATKNNSPQVTASVPEEKVEVTVQVASEPPEAFIKKFAIEAQQIAKIQNKPEQVQLRLNKLAQNLTKQNIDSLYELASDDTRSGDERALAVELLTIRNNAASLTALQNLVANQKNINGKKWDSKKEIETVLRAQAVEGIAGFPEKEIALSTLNYLQQKVDEKFLSDRISRASNSLIMGKPTIQQQDEEALKKLIE